jgi:hypothetical protein
MRSENECIQVRGVVGMLARVKRDAVKILNHLPYVV